MNILFVNHYCGFQGGVERNVYDSAIGLKQQGHSCYLLAQEMANEAAAFQDVFEDVRVIGASASSSGGALDQRGTPWRQYSEFIDAIGPDVIYVHKWGPIECLEQYSGRYRMVRMFHDHDAYCPREHKYFALSHRICDKPMGWSCCLDFGFLHRDRESLLGIGWTDIQQMKRRLALHHELFDRLLVASKYMGEQLTTNGLPSERIDCIPLAIRNSEQLSEPDRVPDEPRILLVGQLVRGKGIHYMLDAMELIHQELPNARLDVVGDGPWRKRLEKQVARLSSRDRITLHGYRTAEQVREFYRDAKVVVMPAVWGEPFGMVGLEAMLAGRPVVAFDVGGIGDWLEDGVTGIFVQELKPKPFGEAVVRVLRDHELASRLGLAGYRRVTEHFSFRQYINNLESVLSGRSLTGADTAGSEISTVSSSLE